MLVVRAKVSGLVLTAVLLAGMASGVTGATSVSANQDASAPVQTQVEGSSSIEQNIKALPASFFIAPNVTEVNMSNARMLARFKLIDPVDYAKISQDDINTLLNEDRMRQGTSKFTRLKNGHYRIYINSAIVKVAKVGGQALAAYLIASSPLSAGASAAAGVAIGAVISAIPSSRGAWFEFSSKGVLLKYGKQ